MNKTTIIEALQQRIPLPWKQSTCDGPSQWKVERQRPEDFTAEIYKRLKKYGMKEDEIRTLFCIRNEDYAKLKQELGATVPAKCVEKSKKQIAERLQGFMPREKKPAETVAPVDRPRIAIATAEDANGLNYQDRHNLGIHTPTEAEKEDVFRPEDDLPSPFVPVEPVAPQPPLQARIEIICNGATVYDLEQLHAKLMDFGMRKQALVSGTLRIVLYGRK